MTESLTDVTKIAYLLEKGIPVEFIAARGEPLCKHCFGHLLRVAPEGANHYRRQGWWKDLLGTKCKVCPTKNNTN